MPKKRLSPPLSQLYPVRPGPDSEALPLPLPFHVTLEQERQEALRQVEIVHRRSWRKTIETHFIADEGGAQWATRSEFNRVLQRLQHADDERDRAFDQYERCSTFRQPLNILFR